MIFRTINADAKKLTEQFGLLNKSFRDIKKDFANGLGFKNSLFQTSISKTDYQALQKFNSAIKVTNDGLTKSQRITKAWNENMTGCSIAAKRMGNDLVIGKKNIQDISKAMNTASGSTKALGVAMNVMANVGFMLAITAITKVISELAQAQDNAAQAAKEATETYKSELDSIADYKQRLSELHEELKSGNLSYEETKTKRTELMTIQDELIEKFGTEKGAIESVTEAVNGQVDALDDLNEKAYRDWVAKADDQTFWNKLLPGGKSGLDQAIDYMETEKTVSFMDMQNANLSDELQAIQKEIDETIRAKYNLDKTFAMFNVTGTPDELRTQLENIRQDYADISKEVFESHDIYDHNLWEEYRKETTDSINEAITSLDEGLEKHQDTYRTYIEGLIKYDSEYSDEYANILQKRAELESAQNSGNEEEVKRAKQEFMDSINDAIIASDSDESIKKYFESLYPELQAEFDNWTFEFDLEANKDGIANTAKEIGEKYTATDLLGMIDDESAVIADSAFNSLIDKAIEYGVCTDKSAEEVQKLIDLLVELGIVQNNVKGDTFNDKNPISLSISDTIDQLNTKLKPAFDSLQSAYQDIFTDDGKFALNSIDILSTCDTIKSKLDEMSDPAGLNLDVDYSAFEDFVRVLNNTASTEQDVENAFDSLATSIAQAALSGTEDFETMKAALEDLGVVNETIIAFQALAENTDALKESGLDLANATYAQLEAFAREKLGAEDAAQGVAILVYQQMLVANNPLDTMASIQALANLGGKAAETAGILAELAQIMAQISNLQSWIANNPGADSSLVEATLGGLERKAEKLKSQIYTGVDFENVGGGSSKASKAGKEAADAYLEAFQKEYDHLKDLLERGEISEAQYLNRLRSLYTRYFKDRKEYLDEYKKYESEYLSGMLNLHNKALSGISTLLNQKISAANDAKDVSISALEEEKEAAAEAYQAQIDAIEEEKDAIDDLIKEKDKKIDALNEEADAIQKAAETRKKNIDLQKEEYNLERMLNQRTTAVYKEGKGFVFEADTTGIRDAREKVKEAKEELEIDRLQREADLIQKEIDLLEEKKDALTEEQEAIQKMLDESNKYYDNLIKQQEKMWDSMISNMEQQKSKWEELADIQEIAEAYSAVQQVFGELGYSVEDVLNGSGSAFEDFKSRYIAIMSDLNQNTSFQEGLEYASGVAKEKFGSIVSDAQNTVQQLSQTFSDGTFSDAISKGVSDGIVAAQQELDNMNQLGNDAGDGFIEGWKEKEAEISDATKQTAQDAVDAFAEGQESHSPSEKYKGLAGDAIDGLLIGVEENKQAFIDTIRSLAEEGALAFEEGFQFDESSIKTLFDSLILLIQSVSEALGFDSEGSVNGLLGALSQLSTFSLVDDGKGILSQFESLKTAVDGVVSAISGGGASGGSTSGSSDKGKGSGTGGGSGLVDAIESFKSATDKALGGGGENGEGEGSEGGGTGAIGQFEQLKTAVDNVTTAIGSEEDEGADNENSDTLIGSIDDLDTSVTDTLGKSGGDGVIGKFEEFRDVIKEAADHVASIYDGLEDIDNQNVECTITINVKMNGSFPQFADGTVLGQMQIESAAYNAQYGKAFASGTIGLKQDEKNALRSEYGQPELTVYPNGTTELTTSPVMSDLPKGTVIYNEEQTKKIMDNKSNPVGNAHADGTDDSIWTTLADGTKVRPLQPGDDSYWMVEVGEKFIQKWKDSGEEFISNAVFEGQKQLDTLAQNIQNVNNITNNRNVQPVINGGINITCPGVTSQEVARQVGVEVNRMFNGLHNYVDQRSRIK